MPDPDATTTTAALLDQAERVLHGIALDLIAHRHLLDNPFTDRPDLSPWTRSTGKIAHAAHDLARDIRKHLGLPYRHGYSGLGTPPITEADIVAEARASERQRIRHLATTEGYINGVFRINGRRYYYVPAELLDADA